MKVVLVSFLILFCHLGGATDDSPDEPSPCDAKEEAQKVAEQKACAKKKLRSQKAWKTKEEALKFIEANLLSKPDELLPYFGCDISDLTQYEFLCESMNPKVEKEELLKFTKELAKFKNVFEDAKWIQRKTDKSYFYICSKNVTYSATTKDCVEGKSLPLVEIAKGAGGFYITGIPVTWVSSMPKK